MRLTRVERGRLPRRLMFPLLRLMVGTVPDVSRTLMYRPPFFGRAYNEVLHQVMRGPSEWNVGERELFAAFVSAQNQCPF